MKKSVLTIGHSTRPMNSFLSLLTKNKISCLVDIRTVPKSRHTPQFNKEALAESLEKAGIKYVHMKGLGGWRRPVKESINTGWRNASFRGYADYMATEEFQKNIENLLRLTENERVVLLCAEAVPWKCHRNLVADALTAKGFVVEHILSEAKTLPHTFTPWAKIKDTLIFYPERSEEALDLFQ